MSAPQSSAADASGSEADARTGSRVAALIPLGSADALVCDGDVCEVPAAR